jgi:predicted RNA-binding Zn ribbon-like protein
MTDPAHRHSRLVPAPRDELCLEFANTRCRRGSEHVTEALNGLGDVLAWCVDAKSIGREAASEIEAWASQHGTQAARLFDGAIAARETIYALFSAHAAGGAVSDRDVDALNRLLASAPCRANLTIARGGEEGDDAGGIRWRLPPATPKAASLLAPVLWSAGDLLVGGRLERVRLCANEKCRWLFLDDSKSGTRRWCSMSSCGNRAKAHRHYMRKTGRPEEPAT